MELFMIIDVVDYIVDDKDDGVNYWIDNDFILSIERVVVLVKEILNNILLSFKRVFFFFVKSKIFKIFKKIIGFLKYDFI